MVVVTVEELELLDELDKDELLDEEEELAPPVKP